MDPNIDDVNRSDLDNLLTTEDNNDDIGNNDASNNTLLQQLLSATSVLQSSVNTINMQMNEMRSQRNDMQSNIDQLKKVVFSADMHGSLFNKLQHGHGIEAMNEESARIGGTDNDVGNDANNSDKLVRSMK